MAKILSSYEIIPKPRITFFVTFKSHERLCCKYTAGEKSLTAPI